MRKKLFMLFISLTVALNFCFFMNVKAYSENAFTDGKCITNTDWQDNATDSYKLNTETGLYELEGTAYSDSDTNTTHIYYTTSDDSKILYCYIPNYDTINKDTAGQKELFDKGIVTTVDCGTTFMMKKTIIGNPPSVDSGSADEETGDNNTESGDSTTESNDGDPISENPEVDSNEDGSDTDVEKIEAPNTASPMAIALIVISIALVGIAVYSFLKRTRPELFQRKGN